MRGGMTARPLAAYRPPPAHRPSPTVAVKPTFDPVLCEQLWPRVNELDDKLLSEGLLKRNTDLSPTPNEQAAILALVAKVTNSLEKLIVAPDLFTAAGVEEVKQVGSFKRNTMLTKHNVADLIVILKTLPTFEAVNSLGTRIVDDIKQTDPKDVISAVPRDYGIEIAATQAVVRLLITTIPPNMKMLDSDLHLDATTCARHLAAIRHQRWFDENATHSTIKVLIRILKDAQTRFIGFKALNAHYSVMNTPSRTALGINHAFRRVLQTLSAGLFLVGSTGLLDPCEPGVRMHHLLKYEEQDALCSTAQTLLRVLAHGGYRQVLGIVHNPSLVSEMSVWEGIVVTPLDRAYDENEMKAMNDDDNDSNENNFRMEN